MMSPMSSSDDVAATDAIAASSAPCVAGRAGPRSLKQPSSAAFNPANMSGKPLRIATPVPSRATVAPSESAS